MPIVLDFLEKVNGFPAVFGLAFWKNSKMIHDGYKSFFLANNNDITDTGDGKESGFLWTERS